MKMRMRAMRFGLFPGLPVTAFLIAAALAGLECASLPPSFRERSPVLAAVSASQTYHGALLLLALLGLAAALFFLWKGRKQKSPARPYLVLLAIVLAAECCLFNFRFFESLTFPAETPLAAAYGDGLVLQTEGDAFCEDYETYEVLDDALAKSATVTLTGTDGAPLTLDSLRLDVFSAGGPHVTAAITCFDEGNALGVDYPAVAVYDNTARAQYFRLHPAGKVAKLVVTVSGAKFLRVAGFSANPRIPLRISPLRMLLLFLALSLAYLIRPGSPLYARVLDLSAPLQKRVTVLVCAVLVLLLICPMLFTRDLSSQDEGYQLLARALQHGQLYLDEVPSDALLSLENPYDVTLRYDMSRRLNAGFYFWDHAFYEGRYYVYFGVVPALFYYLPFRLLTGRSLPNPPAVAVSTALFAIGMFALLFRLARRFRAPRFLTYLLVAVSAVLASGILFAKLPTIYYVPISTGLALAVWGLYLWDTACPPQGKLSLPRLAVGSLLMALVFGCRPQIGLAAALGVPLLLRPVLLEKRAGKERAAAIASIALPFLLVAAGLMWYNAARFGSPFDFGANYNLTSNDMRLRGWNVDRILPGVFYLLFSPPVFSATYPFLQPLTVETAYQGVTVAQPFFGGAFTASPMLLAVAFFPVYRKSLRQKRLSCMSLLLLLLPLVILCLDVEMAGVLPRYKLDFQFLLFLLAAMVCFSIEETESGKLLRLFRWGLFLAAVYGILFAFCYLFAYEPDETVWRDEFPSLIADLCAGWLQ